MSVLNAYWNIWLEEAMRGRVNIDFNCDGDEGMLLIEVFRAHLRRILSGDADAVDNIEMYIDCSSGNILSWNVFDLITKIEDAGVPVSAHIRQAVSAGLIIIMGASRRVCIPRSDFGWHGSTSKSGKDESQKSDETRTQVMADRTDRDLGWWMEKADSGDTYWFKGEEAVEIGICTELSDTLLR